LGRFTRPVGIGCQILVMQQGKTAVCQGDHVNLDHSSTGSEALFECGK